jgi:vacuolar protein sorting-associated protein 26
MFLASWFGSSADLEVCIDAEPNRKSIMRADGKRLFIFTDGEDVVGNASVMIPPGKKLEHGGVRVELIGQLDFPNDRLQTFDFFVISKDLEGAGTLFESKKYSFRFAAVDKQAETYSGTNAKVRWFVRVSLVRPYASTLTEEAEFVVQNLLPPPESSTLISGVGSGIKMEVGIEDALHIEFEFDKQCYHTKDVVIGKVFFLLVRLKIKFMELDIVRKEFVNSSACDPETVAKFEIMDGAPVKNECIPVRMYLSPYDLSPSYKNLLNRVQVKYFLNLVLLDEEDRRYFKQQEITLWRKKIA